MALAAKPKSAAELRCGVRASAGWCFWVAGLTAVNIGMTLAGSKSGFLFGMLAPQVAAQFAANHGSMAKTVAIGFGAVVIGFFVLMGWFARREHRWAFVVALLAYGGDSLLLVLAPSFLLIVFHAWVLFSLL